MSADWGEVNAVDGTVWCGARVVLYQLEAHVNTRGFTLGQLSPLARALELGAFLEGPYAGLRPVLNGRLEPLSLGLEVQFRNGAPWSSPLSPRRAAGPELEGLVLGAGGRYGSVQAATVRLQPRAEQSIRFTSAFPTAVALQRTVLEGLQAGARVGSAAVSAERGRVILQLELEGTRASIERDLAGFRRLCEAHGAIMREPISPVRMLVPRSCTEERELSWAEACAAAEEGTTLELFRLSVDGVIARGTTLRGRALLASEERELDHEALWQRITEAQP